MSVYRGSLGYLDGTTKGRIKHELQRYKKAKEIDPDDELGVQRECKRMISSLIRLNLDELYDDLMNL